MKRFWKLAALCCLLTVLAAATAGAAFAEDSLTLPTGLKTIESEAFYGTAAKAAVVPEGVTEIGERAFGGSGVNGVCLPSTLESIAADVFAGSPDAIALVKDNAAQALCKAQGLPYLRYEIKGDAVTVTKYGGTAATVKIPASIAGLPVTVIGESAFKENTALTAVVIPYGVTTIDRGAFMSCPELRRVEMADSVTTIMNAAFESCAKLEEVRFSAALRVIKGDAFSRTSTDVTEVCYFELPDNLTECDSYVFQSTGGVICVKRGSNSEALIRADSNTVYTHYGETDYRFRYYSGEGERLYRYKGSGPSAEIPSGIWLIDREAFLDHTELTRVVIPEGVTKIDSWAFEGCTGLTDVRFPSSLTLIEAYAFKDCGTEAVGTVRFDLPDEVTVVSGAFLNCPAVLTCTPDSATGYSLSDWGYSYARADRPEELDFRYKWGYFNHDNVKTLGLFAYVGAETQVRLPDDCKAAWADNFKNSGLTLICAQLSDTAQALSNAELNFTFPGHEEIRYRIIDGVLNVMGYTGTGDTLIIPQATAYINAGWDEHIYNSAVRNNENITTLVIPEGVTQIMDYAFCGCVNLTAISFPESLKVLKSHAFESCGSASDERHYYVLPDNLTEINTNTAAGWGAFTGINQGVLVCSAGSETARLVSEVYTNHINGSYYFALKGHQDDGLIYRYERYDTETAGEYAYRLVLWRYDGTDERVVIPADCGIYGIADGVFRNKSALKQVTIPEGVVEIGANAFKGCTLLHESTEGSNVFTLPSTLKTVGNQAFQELGAHWGERFILVLPYGLKNFTTGLITDCGAVLVAPPGSVAANVLYTAWYYYYDTLEDALAHTNLRMRPDETMEQSHIRYGKT